MPELPEVETIKIGLQKRIIGLKVVKIEVLNPKTFQGQKEEVIGLEIKEVWRRAKVLGICLSKGPVSSKILLFHLKMSGQIIWQSQGNKKMAGGHPTADMKDQMPNKSTRVIFTLSDNSKIYFNDQRKFGWIKVIDSEKLNEYLFINNLGPEPLEKEFSPEVLQNQLARAKNTPIKVAIMDQKLISGIGNIYASEACFLAKIDPRTKVKELTDLQYKNLYNGITKTLKDGIKYGGSSRTNYVNAEGGKGEFLNYAYCYKREKEDCKICQTKIAKITLGGRGTFYCPNCQK